MTIKNKNDKLRGVGDVAQLGEHQVRNLGAESSILFVSTKITWRYRQVVKTPPFHGGVVGSKPASVTLFLQ